MADDPYAALGLTKSATDAEIKSAYRRIAKTDHPDLNPDPKAAERFKAASSAYDLLRDTEKRRRFDAGEIDASGQERPQRQYYRDFAQGSENPYRQSYGFEGGDFSDVFDDLFGQRRAGAGAGGARQQRFDMRGQDAHYELAVDFMTAVQGGTSRITLPDGSTLDVKIPKGAYDGQTIRLRGKGGQGYGKGEAGDVYLTLTVQPHPDFRREGDDIYLTLPITIDEATLGGKVAAPTIDGPVNLTIPEGATTGRKLRLRGRGVERAGKRGDQHIELKVMLPSEIDDDLREFMQNWRESHSYDPRKGMKI